MSDPSAFLIRSLPLAVLTRSHKEALWFLYALGITRYIPRSQVLIPNSGSLNSDRRTYLVSVYAELPRKRKDGEPEAHRYVRRQRRAALMSTARESRTAAVQAAVRMNKPMCNLQNVCSAAAGTRHSRPVKLTIPSVVSSPIHRLPNPSSVSVLVCPPTNRNPVATGITLPSAGVYRKTVPPPLAEKYTLPAASVATATIAPAIRCTAFPHPPALLIQVVALCTTESP